MREEQLALTHVLGFVEYQQRVLAESCGEDLVALAGVECNRIGGEDLLHVFRIGEIEPLSPCQVEAEGVSVLRPGLVEDFILGVGDLPDLGDHRLVDHRWMAEPV